MYVQVEKCVPGFGLFRGMVYNNKTVSFNEVQAAGIRLSLYQLMVKQQQVVWLKL